MGKEIKNSINYISKKTSKKTGFSAPLDYFNNLEEVIGANLSEEHLPKENGFKVSDTYFKNLEDSILAKVSFSKKETKIISFKDRILKVIPYATAASIILFIGLNSFVFNTDKEFTLDSLSDTDIEYWLDSNTLNTNDISIIFEDDLLEENDFYFTTIKDETIEEYINSIDNIALFNEIN
jgi:hypothetical protein